MEILETRRLLSGAEGLDWTAGPSLPIALGNTAALNTSQGVLLVGGTTKVSAGTTPSSARFLDPNSNSWIGATASDQGRNGAGIGQTGSPGPIVIGTEGADYKYTSDVFLFGGARNGTVSSSVYNYDLYGTGEEIHAPSMSVARYQFAYATDPATGDLYAIGGLGSSNQALSSAERYDPGTDSWSGIAALPQALSGASAASDGAGHLLVFGGSGSSGTPLSTVYSYTIASDTWSLVSTMPIAATSTAAVFGAYGQVYVLGGRTATGPTASAYTFNPVTNEWLPQTPLPSAVYGASAVIDGNGNLDVLGGFNAAGNAVATMYQATALPAPIGLPAVPNVVFDSDAFVFDAAPHPVSAFAVGSDGFTTIDGTFTFTYDGSPAAPTNAGTYSVLATFASNDPNYVGTVVRDTLYIDPANPIVAVSGGGTITYDGSPHPITATAVGVDGSTAVPGTFAYTYNGGSTAPVGPGTYTAVADFTSSDSNYANASSTTTIIIPDPTIPTGVTAHGASPNSIQVSWNTVAGAAYYNVREKHVLHDPKGSGSTTTYPVVAGNITGTSVIITVAQINSYTFYVTSVSPAGVESSRSAPATAQPLYAPSLASMLWNGAVTSYASVEVCDTLHVTLLGYGNEPPTYTMTSGPSTMLLDPATGAINYTPTAAEAGNFTASFTATNSQGSSSATFNFHVLSRPTVLVSGGTFTFDGTTHSASAVAYASDGVTPVSGVVSLLYAPVAYPTALSTAPYAEAGQYIVQATFTSSDANYGGASGSGLVTINPATPTLSLGNVVVDYTGAPQGVEAAAVGIDGVSSVNGSFAYTYNGAVRPPSRPGTYSVLATFTSNDRDYTDGTIAGTLTIRRATHGIGPAGDVSAMALQSTSAPASGDGGAHRSILASVLDDDAKDLLLEL